jgi:MFS family permease
VAVNAQNFTQMILPMLLIGLGTGLPWGLMDGLSVSVVPKERAGMATGIFSTTRVAGEGISLATVGALLAAFMYNGLATHFSGADIAQASQRLETGDLHQAQRLIPGASVAQLQQIYATSLHHLLLCLMAITLASALVVLLALAGKETTHDTAGVQNDLAP